MGFDFFFEWFYFMNIVYRRFHLSDILTKLGHFLLLKNFFPYDLGTKPSSVSIYFVKSFLKSHSFQETSASNTVSSEANRADKIILNTFGVAMYTKLKSRMVLNTQEKNLREATLRYSCPQIEFSLEITGDYRKFPENYPKCSNFFQNCF